MDWERLGLPLSREVRDILSGEPPAPPSGGTFLRGPIPWDWVSRASRLDGPGFALAMGVWYLAHRFGGDVRASAAELSEWLDLGRTSIWTGLRLARGAGLVSARTLPGRKPLYELVPVVTPGTGPGPLRGPIPWDWWSAATPLPGSSLRVGAVCWTLSGWHHATEFTLATGDWADWGLDRYAIHRGLRCLAGAGLVALTGGRGRGPLVRLLTREGL